MRTRRFPITLYTAHAGHLVRTGTTTVELIEWTHPDGTRTFLVPFQPPGGQCRG